MTPEEIAGNHLVLSDGELDALIGEIIDVVSAERERCANAEIRLHTNDVSGWNSMTSGEKRMWRAGFACGVSDLRDSIRALK
jgi:hypothetical protein